MNPTTGTEHPVTEPTGTEHPVTGPTGTEHPGTEPTGTEGMLRLPAGRRPEPTGTRLATRRVSVAVYAVAALFLLGGAVGGSMALGWWSTDCGVNEAAVSSGTLTPADVKGSMTVQQVADGFPTLTAGDVLAAFGAPAGTATSTQLKTLVQEGSTMDVTSFRTWLEQRPTP